MKGHAPHAHSQERAAGRATTPCVPNSPRGRRMALYLYEGIKLERMME